MIVVSRKTKVPFVFESEKDADKKEQTILFFNALPKRDFAKYGMMASGIGGGDDAVASVDAMFDMVKDSLVGWKNVVDEAGNQVPFSADDLESNMDIFDLNRLSEVFEFLAKINGLGVDDAKN